MKFTYSPDFMLINLGQDFSNFDTEGINNRFLFGIFFHEWLHYFHNVSTNFGMTTFSSTVSLWGLFQNSNTNGVIDNKPNYQNALALHNKLLNFSRRRTNTDETILVINKAKFTSLEIVDVQLKETSISKEAHLHSFMCEIKDSNHPEQTHTVEIGALEIIENLAYLLEKKLVESLNEFDTSFNKDAPFDVPNTIPYRMIELLLHHYFPNLSEDDCIITMIASLQALDCIEVLDMLLQRIKQAIVENKNIKDALSEWIQINNADIHQRLNEMKAWIYDGFPVDDAIGKSIKSVFEIIKSNIELRAKNPFVELDILNAIKADSRNFDKILNLGSTCAFMIKLKPSEIKDPLVKSKLLEIGKMEHLEDWQQFHAALHFVRRHIGSDGQLTNTSEIPNGCCPFFDVCTLKSEQKDINICRNRPWESFDATNPEADMCWYGSAVRQTIYKPQD